MLEACLRGSGEVVLFLPFSCHTLLLTLASLLATEWDMQPPRALAPGGWPQRVPPKVRSDGEVELTASLLAQRLLLLAVLVALLPALPLMFFEFRFLIVILHFLTSLRPLQLALGADGAVCNWVRFF